MNTKQLLLAGVTALLATVGAHAQSIPAFDIAGATDGDLILAARNSSSTKDLVIDLGQISNFKGLVAGQTYTLDAVNIADFTSTFGANAISGNGTKWSVFGAVGSSGDPTGDNTGLVTGPNYSLWATSPVNGGTFVAQQSNTSAAQTTVSNKIDAFNNSLGSGFATLSNTSSINLTSAVGGSYSLLVAGANQFGYFPNPVEGTIAGTSQLELFELFPNAGGAANGVDLGRFTISASGATFTAFQAIPEPSTYAMILGVATLGFAAIRRRKQAQLLA